MTQTIYIPDNWIKIHPIETPIDLSDYAVVEEVLLEASAEGGEVAQETLLALTVSSEGRVHYHYAIGRDGGFTFNLFSMIGQPWQADFQKIIDDNELVITTEESATDICDVITPGGSA